MIKEINVKALKSIAEIQFACKKLNIITGTNSSGKSTLLHALLVIAQNSNSNDGINGKYINIGDFKDANNYNVKDKDIYISLNLEQGLEEIIIDETGVAKNTFFDEKSNSFKTTDFFKHIKYLSCNRIGAEDIYKKNYSSEKDVGINGEFAIYCLEKFKSKNLSSELIVDTNSYTLHSQVNYWLDYILGSSISTEDVVGTDFVKCFYSTASGKQMRPKNVGSGLSYLISVLVLCLLSDSNDIIIIENPEIHLHPKAQSKVCEFLYFIAKSGRQLFVETHSDHIFNGVRAGVSEGSIDINNVSVNFFTMNENNCTLNNVIEFGKRGRILNYVEGLFDQFDIDLNRMLNI